MTEKQRDLLLASVLLILGIGWTITVWQTIPGGFAPGDIGARGFPLVLGVALVILSASLAIKTLAVQTQAGPSERDQDSDADDAGEAPGPLAVVLVVAHIALFGVLMERIGFLLTTAVVVASLLVFCVRERTIWKIAVYSVGTALLSWLVFNKLMGVHLPQGTWIILG